MYLGPYWSYSCIICSRSTDQSKPTYIFISDSPLSRLISNSYFVLLGIRQITMSDFQYVKERVKMVRDSGNDPEY